MKAKKTYLAITFFLGVLFLSYFAVRPEKVFCEFLSCPREKEVPLGKLVDQSLSATKRIVENIKIMVDASAIEYKAGRGFVSLSRECRTRRCKSTCHWVNHTCSEDCNCSTYKCPTSGDSCDCLLGIPETCNYNCPVCEPDECVGSACPFSALSGELNTVRIQAGVVDTAYSVIDDIYNKKVDALDVVGKICENLFLGLKCPLSPKDNEASLIRLYFAKTKNNVENCKVRSYQTEEEIFSQGIGEQLILCQSLKEMGGLENCYKDDFYCCQ